MYSFSLHAVALKHTKQNFCLCYADALLTTHIVYVQAEYAVSQYVTSVSVDVVFSGLRILHIRLQSDTVTRAQFIKSSCLNVHAD